jgi:hypothetical protein
MELPQIVDLVDQLPLLVELKLDGCFSDAARLQCLTQLTALTVGGEAMGLMTGQLLHHIGTLTNLRSLALEPRWWTGPPAEPGWLAQLRLLTSLRAAFDCGRAGLEEMASSVPLRELHLHSFGESNVMSVAACAHIAAARSSLRHLHLELVSLPASMCAEVLPQLTGLTCLRLIYNRMPTMTFSWLTELTALRELQYRNRGTVLPCELLAGLSCVDTLVLTSCPFVDAPYLKQLCSSMPQLRGLDIDLLNDNMGAGLYRLRRLTNLEVLGLGRIADSRRSMLVQGLKSLRAPPSLRRCYLGRHVQRGPEYKRAIARAMLGRQVEAVFSDWAHP